MDLCLYDQGQVRSSLYVTQVAGRIGYFDDSYKFLLFDYDIEEDVVFAVAVLPFLKSAEQFGSGTHHVAVGNVLRDRDAPLVSLTNLDAADGFDSTSLM